MIQLAVAAGIVGGLVAGWFGRRGVLPALALWLGSGILARARAGPRPAVGVLVTELVVGLGA